MTQTIVGPLATLEQNIKTMTAKAAILRQEADARNADAILLDEQVKEWETCLELLCKAKKINQAAIGDYGVLADAKS